MAELEISPLAKRLAEENNVDWRRLSGSGDAGKVVERDVLDYLSRVMSGEEDVNPTPEPLPDGLDAWPEDESVFAGAATGGAPTTGDDSAPEGGETPSSPSVEWRSGGNAGDAFAGESPAEARIRPGYDEPGYDGPSYDEPASDERAYESPSYDVPSYDEPSRVEPSTAEPRSEAAGYHGPSYHQASHDEPAYKPASEAFDYGGGTNGGATPDAAGVGDEEADLDEGIFVFDDEETASPAASSAVPSPAQEWADDLTDFGAHRDDDLGHDLGPDLDRDPGREQEGQSAAGAIEVGGSGEHELDFDWTAGSEQEDESGAVAGDTVPTWDDDRQEPAWEPEADASQQTGPEPDEAQPAPSAAWPLTQPEYSPDQHQSGAPDVEGHDLEPDSVSEGTPEGRFAWEGGTVAQSREDAWADAEDEEELADQDMDAEPSAAALDDDFADDYDQPGVGAPEGVSFEEEETPAHSFTPGSEQGRSEDLGSDGQAAASAGGAPAQGFAPGLGEWTDDSQEKDSSYGLASDAAAGTELGQGVRAGSGIMLRRHTELSNLVRAQEAVASELGVDEAVVSIAFLIRAASRAGYPWPLAAGSERLGVATFGESDIGLASLDGAADMSFRELVSACDALPPSDSADDAALVVADLSGLGIDEAVLDLGCPLLTLGRSIRRGKSGRVFAALGLSGPATAAQGSRFLQRVGDLLVEPVRLLL